MNYRVIFHPIADAEYSAAYQWYDDKKKGLGKQFENVVENQLGKILSRPLLYPKKRGMHREANLEGFPYLIVYKVYSKEQIIFVSAFFHTSRNPKKKYKKK